MTDFKNPYTVGSLLWIERNTNHNLRHLLDSLLSGALSADDVREWLHAYDTDSATN